MLQFGIALFLVLSLAAVVRTLRTMRLGNALQSGALLFKITLNFLGAALMVAVGAELATAYQALALVLVFFQFLNPVALSIYFNPPRASSWPLAVSLVFAAVMMPALIWYGVSELGLLPPHPMPTALFAFSLDTPGEFGSWSILYKIFTPLILGTLIVHQLQYYRIKDEGFLRSKRWELLYLISGLVRALVLIGLLAFAPGDFDRIYRLLTTFLGLSLLLDTGIILVFATSRPVQFYRDYGLELSGTWTPELEAIVRSASDPQHLAASKFGLQELADHAKIPSYLVTQYVNRNTGMQVKELLNHFRLRRFDELTRMHPKERKKALLAQVGFNSYAAYYAARKAARSH